MSHTSSQHVAFSTTCEVHGDFFNELWLEDVDMASQPEVLHSSGNDTSAKDIRDALVKYYM